MIRINPKSGGWLEVVCGPMFSGKSEEMIRRLRRAEIAGQRVVIFKPRIDDRYSRDHITSHSAMQIEAECVSSSRELLERVKDDTSKFAKVEMDARFEGRQVVMVLAPR